MKIHQLREKTHVDFLNARSIKYIVDSSDFELTYTGASKEYRGSVLSAISKGQKERLKLLVKTRLLKLTPFDRMTIRQLRSIAKHNRVFNYCNLDKLELVREIKDVVKRLKKDSKQVLHQSKETNS